MVKAGLEMFTKSTAMMLAEKGVRVNAVAPSYMDTNFYRAFGMDDNSYSAMKNRV